MSRRVPECLRWAGALGHAFVVTRINHGDAAERHGTESVSAETNSLESAQQALNELAPEDRGAAYERTARGWRRIAKVEVRP